MNRLTTIAVAITLTTSSCAWVFMDRPAEKYALGENPECTDTAGAAIADGIFLALNVAGTIAIAGGDGENKEASMAFGIGWSVIHLASALTAFSWADTCRKAKAEYERRDERDEITPGEREKRRRLEARLAREETKRYEADKKVAPRGFFCSSSPSNGAAGFCVRAKAECQRTRDVSIAATDLGECALTERAFCFGDRCAPSAEGCDAMRERVIGPDGSGPACADSE